MKPHLIALAIALLSALSTSVGGAQAVHLRIHAIKVANTDGTRPARITPNEVSQWVKTANAIFGASGAGIVLHFVADSNGPDWEVLNSTTLNQLSSSGAGWSTANTIAAKYPSKVVVFFRHGTATDTVSGNGFAFPPQSGKNVDFVAMPGFTVTGVPIDDPKGAFKQNDGLFAHELGHYLGLNHTFPGWNDLATDTDTEIWQYILTSGGKEAALDGDGIPDTPPEAGAAYYANKGWKFCSGPASYTVTTKLGFKSYSWTFTPQRDNIMSYFACGPMRLTAGQVARMKTTLQLPSRKTRVHAEPPFIYASTQPAATVRQTAPSLKTTPFIKLEDQPKERGTTKTADNPRLKRPPPPPDSAKPAPKPSRPRSSYR
jgi:hypothetical protein